MHYIPKVGGYTHWLSKCVNNTKLSLALKYNLILSVEIHVSCQILNILLMRIEMQECNTKLLSQKLVHITITCTWTMLYFANYSKIHWSLP